MLGKCKILLVLAAFLAIPILTPHTVLAAIPGDTDCTCPPSGCVPGAGGQGDFQNYVTQGFNTAGQRMSKSYMYGSYQVSPLDVSKSYGLSNIDGLFNGLINDLDSIIDAAADPFAWLASKIAGALLNNLKSRFPAINGLLDSNNCLAVPSFNFTLGANLPNFGWKTANNFCNGVLGAAMQYDVQQGVGDNIYQLMWSNQ